MKRTTLIALIMVAAIAGGCASLDAAHPYGPASKVNPLEPSPG